MKKFFFIVAVVTLVGFAGYKYFPVLARKIMGTPAVRVQVDGTIAPMLAKQIERECRESFSPMDTSWIAELKKKFVIIARISSSYAGKTVLITITSAHPIALINDDLVVDKAGAVYQARDLNSELFSTLKRITVAKTSDMATPEFNSTSFKEFIATLPDVILSNYRIDWRSPFMIYLTPLFGGSLSIIRFDDIPTQERLLLGQKLLGNTKKKVARALVDFRFNDQIIIGEQK